MIKRIHVVKYRKLENMDLEFSKGINVISGTNGTCKTSLLHIVRAIPHRKVGAILPEVI